MAVIRVHKTKDYTVMSNAHFREKKMSLKAKGLLSQMMSLPDDWDYSIAGLTTLSKDGKDSVMSALNELEKFGYLKRTRLTDDGGRFAGYDYDIFEQPQMEKPYAENPNTVKPNAEKSPQLSTKRQSTKKTSIKEIKKVSKKDSFDQLIQNYCDTLPLEIADRVKELLQDWLKVRKAKRAAMTDKSIELNLNKLTSLADKSNMAIDDYLEEVICRGWQAFYEIKDYNGQQAAPQKTANQQEGVLDRARRMMELYEQEEAEAK